MMDLLADQHQFEIVCYRDGVPMSAPAGKGWFAAAFAASQSSDTAGIPQRTGWILWARTDPSRGVGEA